jgi:D-ribose pyranose/furanose isomerase RbsD
MSEINKQKVCYVCGKVGLSLSPLGKYLSRCSSQLCYIKAIQGIDRLYIDISLIPEGGLEAEWKLLVTKQNIPFLGVDTNKKGQISVIDPFVPVPKQIKKIDTYGKEEKAVTEWGSVSHLIELLKTEKYTEEELVSLTKLAPSTVKSQLSNKLKQNYELDVISENGKTYYRILNERY